MEPGGILKDIVDNLLSSASVNAVFGETRETQGKAIIPMGGFFALWLLRTLRRRNK